MLPTHLILQRITLFKTAKVYNLDVKELAVLQNLTAHCNTKTLRMNPSEALMAEEIGASKRTVERAIKGLKEKGLITYLCPTGSSNHYKFTNSFLAYILPENIQTDIPRQIDDTPTPNLASHPRQIGEQIVHEQILRTGKFINPFSSGSEARKLETMKYIEEQETLKKTATDPWTDPETRKQFTKNLPEFLKARISN